MPRLDPADWAAALRRVADGATLEATAGEFGIHPSTLSKRIRLEKAGNRKRRVARSAAPAGKPEVRRGAEQRATAKAKPASVDAAPPPAKRKTATRIVRRQLINRLYRAIDTKLKLMERRMNSEIAALDEAKASEAGSLTAADHERETRAFGALVKTINSVRQLQAELDDVANANPNATAADVRLAADADRYRRDVAERLAKFIPSQS